MIFMSLPSLNDKFDSQNVNYTNQDMPGVTNVKQALDSMRSDEHQILFDSYAEFPAVGEVNKLYVDTSTKIIYMFDNIQNIYKPTTSDINNYIIQATL